MAYRTSRNIEASYVTEIRTAMAAATPPWTGINVEVGFPDKYKGKTPLVAVEALEKRPVRKEIGSKEYIKYYTVKIRFFADDDGQRMDFAEWLADWLVDDVKYYTFVIANDVATGTLAGKMVITKWFNDEKELVNTENLEHADKFRHLLAFEIKVV